MPPDLSKSLNYRTEFIQKNVLLLKKIDVCLSVRHMTHSYEQ